MTTITDKNNPVSKAPYKKPGSVRFTVLSADELECMSVTPGGISNLNTYEDGKPTEGGINDPRMGPIDFNTNCLTCAMNQDNCPGHFGHIKLAQPMFSWGFLKTSLQCLRCVCHWCSRLLVPEDDLNLAKALASNNPKQRLQAVATLCRTKKRCTYAGTEDVGEVFLGVMFFLSMRRTSIST